MERARLESKGLDERNLKEIVKMVSYDDDRWLGAVNLRWSRLGTERDREVGRG